MKNEHSDIPESEKEVIVSFSRYLDEKNTYYDVSIVKKANGDICVRLKNSQTLIEIPDVKILALADYIEKMRRLSI